jgi:Flp pilus assembly protein TadG
MKNIGIRKIKDQTGASAVELALVMPLLVMVLFAIFQFGIAFNNWISLTHAAREGARLAAVGQYDENRIRESSPSVIIKDISVDGLGGNIGAVVSVTVVGNVLNIVIPFAGNWPISLTSTASMRIEQSG